MRILVTGGAGFIGRPVVRELVAQGVDVTVLDSLRPDVHRQPDPVRAELGARLVEGDVRDAEAVARAVDGVDAVVHLAAKVGLGVSLEDLDDYVSSNDLGTAVLLTAMARAGIGRLTVASSMVVYGEGAYACPDHGSVRPSPRRAEDLTAGRFEPSCPTCGRELSPGLVREDAPMDPRNTYAATKLHQEHLAAIWARETSAQATALRFHNVYGVGLPRDTPYAGVAALFASALRRGESPRVFEDGAQRRDFVHVDDVARAVARSVTAAPAADGDGDGGSEGLRAYNVGSGRVRSIGDLAVALAEAWGGPAPVVTGEFRLGDVRHVTASSARIDDELGWRATVPFADGVAELAAWLRNEP